MTSTTSEHHISHLAAIARLLLCWADNRTEPAHVMDFYYRDWFSRIWVIQEVVRAQNVVVLLPGYEISWDWVGLAAAIIVSNPTVAFHKGCFALESIPMEPLTPT